MAIPISGEGGGPNPPYGEDFFGRIVNVHWRKEEPRLVAPQQGLVGARDFVPGAETGPFIGFWVPPFYTVPIRGSIAQDGVVCGASGKGFTVFTNGFVAFGHIEIIEGTDKIERDCFVAMSQSGDVQLGIVEDKDTITWRSVFSVSFPVALTFANNAFFISYISWDGIFHTYLAVSFDGENFTSGISPFAGVPTDDTFQDQYGGGVAYKDGTYAITGGVVVSYSPGTGGTGFQGASNFMWATSSDGLLWSSGYNSSITEGIGSRNSQTPDNPWQPHITVGNGIFVSAASEKTHWVTPEDEKDYILVKCAVAVSQDGQSWSLVSLPGAYAFGSYEKGDSGGSTWSVVFVPTGKDSGFFAAIGVEVESNPGPIIESFIWRSKLWTSEDGQSWTMVGENRNTTYGMLSTIDQASTNIVEV